MKKLLIASLLGASCLSISAEETIRKDKEIPLTILIEGNNPDTFKAGITTAASEVREAAAKGNPEPFLGHFKSILMADERFTPARQEALRLIVLALMEATHESWSEWTTQQLTNILPAFEALQSPGTPAISAQVNSEYTTTDFVLNIAAGRAETYQLFVTSLDQDAQRQIDRWIDLDRFFEHLTAATESFSQEERVSLLKEVFALPGFSNRFDAYGDLFKKLIATSLLTVDTVIAHSDAFTHLLPRWGTTSAELAEILMSQGKIQQSIPYWEQAIAIAGEHKTTNFVNIHQRRAAALAAIDRPDEAVLFLTRLDWEQIDQWADQVRPACDEAIAALLLDCKKAGLPGNAFKIAIERIAADENDPLGWQALAALYDQKASEAYAADDLKKAVTYLQLAIHACDRLNEINSKSLMLDKDLRLSKLVRFEAELADNSETLIDFGSDWHFHDQGTDLGSEWRTVEFDASGWQPGKAPLGYGDKVETIVYYGPQRNEKYVTTCFRRSFEFNVDNEYPEHLIISLLCDDGAIIYINGEEEARFNMPEGEIEYSTLAHQPVFTEEEGGVASFSVDARAMKNGINHIAVEVHQAMLFSSDLHFDLQLETSFDQTKALLASPNPEDLAEALGEDAWQMPETLVKWLAKRRTESPL